MYNYYKQKFLTWYKDVGYFQFLLGNELFVQPEFEDDAGPFLCRVLFGLFLIVHIAMIVLIFNIIISYL